MFLDQPHTIQRLAILGATGSVGKNTLDIVARYPERFKVEVLAAGTQEVKLFALCQQFNPRFAVMNDEAAAKRLKSLCKTHSVNVEVLSGSQALCDLVVLDTVDTVVSGIVGAVGCLPTLAAVRASKKILLANKESLVLAGSLMMEAAKQSGAILMPVDSEHNALFQCWEHKCAVQGALQHSNSVHALWLTASGGPFRTTPLEILKHVTPEQACKHPKWSMGKKISVDSATLMNKALEIIEAYWLFGLPAERIKAVVHPQSIVHAMVSYKDGSTLAQCGYPDMRVPIAYGLSYPDRLETGVEHLDCLTLKSLDFEEPDHIRFPALKMVEKVLNAEGTAAIYFNAANEIAVEAFLNNKISFLTIYDVVNKTLDKMNIQPVKSIDHAIAEDQYAREIAKQVISLH
ncbi:MAG: 1-deoxy-D-xylulose-5-phosphate reductoisomerase [Pseudomonadota bacterium]